MGSISPTVLMGLKTQQLVSAVVSSLFGLFLYSVFSIRAEKPERRLPQAVIIGVAKTGTRALLEFLNMHPDIVVCHKEVSSYTTVHFLTNVQNKHSKTHRKEEQCLLFLFNSLQWFNRKCFQVHFYNKPENYKKGEEWYRAQMPLISRKQITVEKSPAYFTTAGVESSVFDLYRRNNITVGQTNCDLQGPSKLRGELVGQQGWRRNKSIQRY